MSIGLSLWFMKRSNDRHTRLHARDTIRHRMRQQYNDYRKRGRGNRAWKRADALARSLRAVTVDPFEIARGCL